MDYLTELANKYASDKGTLAPLWGHHGPRLHFTPVYYPFFEALRNKKIKLLEIGIGSGPSLKMWYDFFPLAEIHAVDIAPQTQHDNDRVKTHVGDQGDRASLAKLIEKIGGEFDIIIDDGSHVIKHQQISLGFLFKYLKSGGQYWIEDLHTSDGSVWQGKQLYGYDMSFKEGESTVQFIERFIQARTSTSNFLTEEENTYLTQNVSDCKLFNLPTTQYGLNKLAYFGHI
jgi:hypothetical protein